MSRPETKPRATSRSKPRLTARTADKHDLYQRSVQAPEYELEFLTRAFRRHSGRKPLQLREDFCGTALLCAQWVKSDRERRAVGLDIDQPTLDWGLERNIAPLGDTAKRVSLLPQDVCVPTDEKFEIVCAYNYSYSVFQTREALATYFRAAYASLRDDGIFTLDAIGGWEAQQVMTEKRAVDGGFTYVWEQAEYDPITSHFVCHISFEFRDGTRMPRAFTYDWRLWQLRELSDLLKEVGFVSVDAYWEGEDEDGNGSGTFHRVEHTTNDPGWNAYLVAKKSASLPGTADARRARKRVGKKERKSAGRKK